MPVRSRPTDLAEYAKPPLNEVIFDVQFEPASGYQQAYITDVWDLFRSNYPQVQEHPPLQPQFEVFGRRQPMRIGVGLVSGAEHSRYWFISKSNENLIQFQNDRFIHNWRKIGNETNEYPRFEQMFAEFDSELTTLERFFTKFEQPALRVNQTEVTYINHIENETNRTIGHWFNLLNLRETRIEDLSLSYRRVLKGNEHNAVGRLHVEFGSATKAGGKDIILFKLTVRGSPTPGDKEGALTFMRFARETIVNEFTSITTKAAHKQWKRKQ